MRKIIIAGNWKMHRTAEEAQHLTRILLKSIATESLAGVTVILCPPFTALHSVAKVIEQQKSAPSANPTIELGAQNMFYEEQGAFTGEISAPMLLTLGCKWVIIGHSERRRFLGETDELINKKLLAAVNSGLKPIFCVGENLDEREKAKTESVVTGQLESGLVGFGEDRVQKITIAYEPVWAIGTGRNATPQQAGELHHLIRQRLGEWFGDCTDKIPILYGGSVKADIAESLLKEVEIDGLLVGGASLKAEEFTTIVKAAHVKLKT